MTLVLNWNRVSELTLGDWWRVNKVDTSLKLESCLWVDFRRL